MRTSRTSSAGASRSSRPASRSSAARSPRHSRSRACAARSLFWRGSRPKARSRTRARTATSRRPSPCGSAARSTSSRCCSARSSRPAPNVRGVADALLVTAVAAGKLTRLGLQVLGRGGTALPGLVTLAIDPDAIGHLAGALAHGSVCVSGTNGKTTTARMVSDSVRAAGWEPVHNRSGSNLDRGIAAALVADSTWGGQLRGDVGVFEVDEASVGPVLARLVPRVLVVTNLFRDQLDRYFEIDALAKRIAGAIATLPGTTTLVLNADDPIVAYLGNDHRGPVLTFGVDDPTVGGTVAQAISDATRCPRCHAPLRYARVVLAHEGDWHCERCGLSRPRPDVSAVQVHLGGDQT